MRGIIFRRWATSILRQYMLKGYVVDPARTLVTNENYMNLVNIVNRIDSTQSELITRVEKLESKYPELDEKILWDRHLWDAVARASGRNVRISAIGTTLLWNLRERPWES